MNSELSVEENFSKIIDPETNQEVLLESQIGMQVIKNYIECLKNGPNSENIISTKMFYPEDSQNEKEEEIKIPINNNAIEEKQPIENIYEHAKTLETIQLNGSELKSRIQNLQRKTPVKGNLVWIQRSSGKWQRGIISDVLLGDNGDPSFNVYFRTTDGKIGSKKNLDEGAVLFY